VIRRSYGYGDSKLLLIDGIRTVCWLPMCKDHHDRLTGLVGGHRSALVMPPKALIERGLYRRWWVWYDLARPAVPRVSLPSRVLKSGAVLWPTDYVKEVVAVD
jgi:hypothetical protein